MLKTFLIILYFKGEEADPTETGTTRPRELHFGQLRTHLQVLSDNIYKCILVCITKELQMFELCRICSRVRLCIK